MPDEETPRVDSRPEAGPRPEAGDDEVEPRDPPIEPGSPSVENALFVLLGLAMALVIVLRLLQLFG